MDLKVIHETIDFYLNKAQQGYITPEEKDLVLDRAQIVLLNQYHTNPKLPAQAQANLLGESQRIDDALSLFKAQQDFLPINTPGGVITLQSDYLHLLSLYTTTFNSSLGRNVYSGVQILNEEELIERLESQVIPVSSSDPVAIMRSLNRIQLFPEVGSTGRVYYIRRPNKPVFAYTMNGRQVVYNLASSTQLEWRDIDVNNIISIALSYYGLNFSSQEVMRFAELKTQQGQ